MHKTLKFDCGCEVVLDPSIPITYWADKYQGCNKTWEMICRGDTKGLFQIESNLGKTWSQKILPDNIQVLSDIISLIRPGCVSKDTKILIKSYNNQSREYKKITISQLYNLFHNKKGRYENTIVSIDSFNNIIQNKIIDIIYTGQKEIFKPIFRCTRQNVSTEKFYDLECTEDHKLLVLNRGWISLADIEIGDRVAVIRPNFNNKSRVTKNIPGQKHFRNICFQNYEYKCIFCDWLEGSLDVNHLDGNRKTNNNPDNLCFMCPNHHRLYSEGKISKEEVILARKKYILPNTDHIYWAQYIGKQLLGIKDVYDISVEAPNHNFIAGNVVVHNCLKAYIGDKSMTQHYADRRNKKEEVEYIHESIKDILDKTFQIIVYQEQIIKIAKVVANFNLKEADDLRKGIGKKKADLLAKLRELFVNKAEEHKIITREEAIDLFNLIEASNRYSFNASHGISYATQSYQSAFIKQHFPLFFYESWLKHAGDTADRFEEMYELVEDAKLHNILVKSPDLRYSQDNFSLDLNSNSIYFGLGNIKDIGNASITQLRVAIKKGESYINKNVADWTWYEFLAGISDDIKTTVVSALIQSGALDYMGVPRKKMMYEYEQWKKLTPKEKSCITLEYNSFPDLKAAIQHIIDTNCTHGEKRAIKIKDIYNSLSYPPIQLDDTASDIIRSEVKLLGVPLSRASVDDYDHTLSTCTCKELYDGQYPRHILIGVEIKSIKEHKTKNKDKMAFLTVTDGTAIINNVTVFPDEYSKYRPILTPQNMVYIHAIKSNNGYNSIIAKKISEMNLTKTTLVV